MATNHRRPIDGLPIPMLLLLLLITARCAEAQSSPNSNSSNNNNSNYFGTTTFSPSMAIVIVVLIAAFFLLGFFSIYIRQCAGDRIDPRLSVRGGVGGGRSRRGAPRGLDQTVLQTFPTLVYSEVKGLKIGKGTLECAVCLSEFEDDETLRLLPKCSHVFHPDCIDAWLASHVTCPVCRSNLVPDPNAPAEEIGTSLPSPEPETSDLDRRGEGSVRSSQEEEQRPAAAPPEHLVIAVEQEADRDRKAEVIELARIGSVRRAMGSKSKARPPRFSRSHSTGHSIFLTGENLDRFTLRLPENVRREIVAAGKLQRTTSFAAFRTDGEGSSRRGYRGGGGEGSSRAGRSIRLGRSDRWPSFLFRTLSARVPAWAAGRRGEAEGSVKKGEGEGSTRGKFSAVRAPFECLGGGGGGGGKSDVTADDDESTTAKLARV